MRDFLKIAPFYMGGLAAGIALALLAGIYPAVIVMGVIIVLSFTIVLMVMRVGTIDDQPLHEGPAKSVGFWETLADRSEARRNPALQATATAPEAASALVSDEAEKERKRQEALARKAARQAKSTGE